MPISVALFSLEIGGTTYAFDTGDISFGDAETKDIPKNVGTNILKVTVRRRNVTFKIRGANAANLTSLYAARDNSITALINATGTVAGQDLVIGADTIYSALLMDVQAGPPITVAGNPIVEEVNVRFDSQVYV